MILQLSGRELLTQAGSISQELSLQKSADKYEKYKASQKILEKEASLKELEEDLRKIDKGK